MATWWMMQYGGPTPKRLQARSNWFEIESLQMGRLAAKFMKENTKFRTARKTLIVSQLWTAVCFDSSFDETFDYAHTYN